MIIEYDSSKDKVNVSIPIEDRIHGDIEDRIVNSFWDIFTQAMLALGYSNTEDEYNICKAIANSFDHSAMSLCVEKDKYSELFDDSHDSNENDSFFYWLSKDVYNKFICTCSIDENELLSGIRNHEIYPNKRETDNKIVFELCNEEDVPLVTIISVSKNEDKKTIADAYEIANTIVTELFTRALPENYKNGNKLSFF